VTYTSTLANPLPNGLIPAAGVAGGLATNLGQAIQFFDPKMKLRIRSAGRAGSSVLCQASLSWT